MNYFASPGYIQHDKGIIIKHGTIAKPKPDIQRVNELTEGDEFKIGTKRYRVMSIKDGVISYNPYHYHRDRKKSFLDCLATMTMGANSMEYVVPVVARKYTMRASNP